MRLVTIAAPYGLRFGCCLLRRTLPAPQQRTYHYRTATTTASDDGGGASYAGRLPRCMFNEPSSRSSLSCFLFLFSVARAMLVFRFLPAYSRSLGSHRSSATSLILLPSRVKESSSQPSSKQPSKEAVQPSQALITISSLLASYPVVSVGASNIAFCDGRGVGIGVGVGVGVGIGRLGYPAPPPTATCSFSFLRCVGVGVGVNV